MRLDIICDRKYMNKKQINFSAINLGCTKNLVDLEFFLWEILKENTILPLAQPPGDLSLEQSSIHLDFLKGEGHKDVSFNFYEDPEDREVEFVIINTCGFLSSSRNEAEETMKYYDKLWKKLIIIWCYTQVKNDYFLNSLENLWEVLSYKDFERLKDLSSKKRIFKEKINEFKLKKFEKSIWDKAFIYDSKKVRAFLKADLGYEYLKIAEWCNNSCSFCIIPEIRWKQKSRTIEDIVKEVEIMVNSWIKEIEIISQDTTRYWVDLYKAPKLLELLKEIDKIEWDFKYRLFYMYPDILSLKHLERLSKLKKLLPYFDFPFQHISPKILKNMGRFYDENHIYKLLDYIKSNFKNPFFHTNFIVWFPWETEENFEKLLDFAKKYEFDSVSVFGYHDEPLAKSSKLENKVNDVTIASRLEKLKSVLNEIYNKKNLKRIWKKQIWFIEAIDEEKAICKIRPEIKAPEIDDVDEIKFEDLIWMEYVNIWDKVKYMLK